MSIFQTLKTTIKSIELNHIILYGRTIKIQKYQPKTSIGLFIKNVENILSKTSVYVRKIIPFVKIYDIIIHRFCS